MTSETVDPDPADVRLQALRAALRAADEPHGDPPHPGSQRPVPPHSVPEQDADELTERLRTRRSAGHVAAAYTAVHGHPLTSQDGAERNRWALTGRAAVAACVVLLAVALAVAAVALWPRGGVDGLGIAVGSQDMVEGADDRVPVAPDGAAPDGAAPDGAAPDTAGPGDVPTAAPSAAGSTAGAAPEAVDVVVHVVGQVTEPGLVVLSAGSRVADAVEAAGGPTIEADLAALNLARAVVDGEQVHVPAPGEEIPEAPAPGGAGTGGTDSGTGGSGPGGPAGAAPVPLNTADATALTALPGIGPVIAERIVTWRDQHGPFTRIEELTEVSGIGPALLENVRDLVTL